MQGVILEPGKVVDLAVAIQIVVQAMELVAVAPETAAVVCVNCNLRHLH